jgi:hypothetical protein
MKKPLFTVFLIVSLTSMAQNPGIKVEGRKVVIAEKNYEMVIDSRKGGRIISMKMDGTELLSQKHGTNKNFGSTLWFSPQIAWNWPPSKTLDRKPYSVEILQDAVLLKSRKCKKFKLQFEKKISFDSSIDAFVINYTIINAADYNQCLAPWEVTRLKKGCRVFFPLGDKAPLNHFTYGGNTWHYSDKEQKSMEGMNLSEGLFNLKVEDKNHDDWMKFFADGDEGWVAYSKDDILFIKSFEDIDYTILPLTQSEVEVYVNPKRYIEVEEHGSYTWLKPGEKLNWQVKWFVRRTNKEVSADDVRGIIK